MYEGPYLHYHTIVNISHLSQISKLFSSDTDTW